MLCTSCGFDMNETKARLSRKGAVRVRYTNCPRCGHTLPDVFTISNNSNESGDTKTIDIKKLLD